MKTILLKSHMSQDIAPGATAPDDDGSLGDATMSSIAIEIPEDLAQRLKASWGDLSRRATEALAAEAYRAGELTSAEVQRMLKLPSRWEADAFLQRAQAYLDYTEADLERDIDSLRELHDP
jgi:post-segregation antitoxin (ccd killing protein)